MSRHTILAAALGIVALTGASTAAQPVARADRSAAPQPAAHVEKCITPVTQARGAKDPHAVSQATVRAMEHQFRTDMQAKLGTTNVATAAKETFSGLVPTTIPVRVHVITDGTAATNVSDAVLARQMDVLNAAYAGNNAGALSGTGFSFQLVSTERITNAKWSSGVTPGSRTEKLVKASRVGNAGTLNIWITGLGSSGGSQLFGWATFPADYAKAPGMDGLMVDRRTLEGQPGAFTGYSEGDTATHEIGHWLGLWHTFQGGCAGGDEVSDTAAEASPASGCPAGRDTCNTQAGEDPIHNYMDYSNDACLSEFTQGQAQRMQAQWATYRAG